MKEIKYEEHGMLVEILKNGLVICGCIFLIPAVGFQTSLAIGMIIYGLNIDHK